ncbi:MAG: PLP-dependent aminotransferase family protein [Eubacterium sp.]|jgi:Transcriptional regulators containing a DNA-binding HTH domain and an aminotransferase domain (MocR family) and their eukaryotic orthologs|nr:PLP-dependent aminotransferase family protein [Eubacterium sp.]
MEYHFSKLIQGIKPSAADRMLEQMNDPELLSLAGGNPSPETFPIEEIRQASSRLLETDPIRILQYSVTEGYAPLRKAAREYFVSRGQHFEPDDELIITSGSQQAPDLAAKCFLEYGDVVVVEDPSYYLTLDTFRSHGIRLAGVPMEEDGMDLHELEKAIRQYHPKMLYTIPNFHNPTGITTSLEKRQKIYDICTRNHVLILEDNPYGDICFGESELPLIKNFDSEGSVILAQSLSKIIAPGLRVSACIANKKVIQKFILAKRCADVHTPTWGQYICEQILVNLDMDEHIRKLRLYYKEKCDVMLNGVEQYFPEDIKLIHPQGGMFMWVTLPDRFSMPDIVERALDQNVAVVPGNIFFVDQNAPCQSIRMNYSTPSVEDIGNAVSAIGKILRG